ncbi:MAG: tRNA (adenosine(37)-N6)-dimethylallyltransferase MiaA [Planctomycetaceae bacterium]|nr:tRNA (adenosine(37)-N6)-dimethylallyltransferase MiaA [Planctomycetaceae bacterium]|tara:strand:+ start:11746 stop:12708 length:963 start_codon:yes stop_codon:yes gene_type:complete
MQFPPVQDVCFLTGPTASGKSAAGVQVAQQINAEIISMDSMAVYREMNIGTAKPSAEERSAVKHHMIDLVTPDQEFSISQYLNGAHAAIESIRKKNRKILFVGGTPLYLKALLTGFDDGPQADWNLRSQLEAKADAQGSLKLFEELRKKDPQAAERIHPHDQRRVIRALEYFQKTGQSILAGQTHFDLQADRESVRVIALDWPREILHSRINARVKEMFQRGWVEEVRHLIEKYEALGRTAMQAVGYRQIAMLLRDEIDLETAIQKTQAGTRQLARRQLIWLRSLSECQRISLSPPMDMNQVTLQIIQIGALGDFPRSHD